MFQTTLAADLAVFQKFLPHPSQVVHNIGGFFLRQSRVVKSTAISVLTAVMPGKQFPEKRQELVAQFVRDRIGIQEYAEPKVFQPPLFWRRCGLLSGKSSSLWRDICSDSNGFTLDATQICDNTLSKSSQRLRNTHLPNFPYDFNKERRA